MNPVYFVGAGPGDPELLTLKGRRLLDAAGLIVFAGSLVNPALLTGLSAEVYDSAGLNLEEIVDLMVNAQHLGRRVVRLHTGDPAIFGAIKEQMVALDRHGVPYEVVPGVSSMAAAAAALKSELTLPEVSQTVIITRQAGRTPVPEAENLTSLARHQATMMIFLSAGLIEQVVVDLLAGGYRADTPVAVVERVGPMIALTLSRLMKRWNTAMPCSLDVASSSRTSSRVIPLSVPLLLSSSTASWTPAFCCAP